MILPILSILNIFSFITLCKADTINLITPTNGQVFKNPIINVNYQIQRNGMLLISNTTTDLLDNTGTLLKSIFTDTTLNSNVNLQLDTNLLLNKNSNFNIRITGFGKYNSISNGNISLLFMNIQNVIFINVDLTTSSTNFLTTMSSTMSSTMSKTMSTTISMLTTPTSTSIISNGVNNKILSILTVFIMMCNL